MAYSPVEWNTGDVITAAKLNNMDDGIADNETKIEEINTEMDDMFITRTYSCSYSVDANPGYVTITNAMLNRTNIEGYSPVAIIDFYSGNRLIVPFSVRAGVEGSTSAVAFMLNTSNSAISDQAFTINILYKKNR